MIISCLTNSYGRFGPAACIERIRSTGLRHVELPIKTACVPSIFGEEPILTDQSGPAEIDAVQQLLDEHDVQLSSCNVTSGNPLDRNVVVLTLRKLELASQLGATLVVAGAGEADSPADRRQLLDHLRRIGDAAGERGLIYCCETHPGICQNAGEMLATMNDLDHPAVRINFDTGNILFYNAGADIADELPRIIDWVRHVHLKDHNGQPGEWYFPAFGRGGAVDFAQVRRILDEAGFNGPCSLEIEGIKDEPPLSLDEHHQHVVESVAELRRCAFDVR